MSALYTKTAPSTLGKIENHEKHFEVMPRCGLIWNNSEVIFKTDNGGTNRYVFADSPPLATNDTQRVHYLAHLSFFVTVK
jgi:hypothetical protein